MSSLRLFTDAEMQWIKKIIAAEMRRVNPGSPSVSRPPEWDALAQAPEVYIAKPDDESGIPAVTVNDGTGENEDDEPGYADCTVYQITDPDTDTPILERVDGLTKRVFNLTGNPISQDWTLIVRDKFGRWIATAPTPPDSDAIIVTDVDNDPCTLGTGTGTGCPADTGTGTAVPQHVAFYRTSHTVDGVCVRRIDCDDVETCPELKVFADRTMRGVHYTDSKIKIRWACDHWNVISHGDFFWGDAVAQEDIAASATGEVELYAGGPIVDAYTDDSIASGTSCDVNFDDQAQMFKITAQRCPPEPVGTGTA